jgi:hypothetical protein
MLYLLVYMLRRIGLFHQPGSHLGIEKSKEKRWPIGFKAHVQALSDSESLGCWPHN